MDAVTGFRISAAGLAEVSGELARAGEGVRKIAAREYHALLAEKAAFIADNIALGIYSRNPGGAIIDDAERELKREMDAAAASGSRSPYNFTVYAHVIPHEGSSYVRAICPNARFLKAFRRMEPFSLTAAESRDPGNGKTRIWLALFEKSKGAEPLGVNLTPSPETDPGRLRFPEPRERAEKAARHGLLGRYMGQISGGAQIHPSLTMEYLDRALEMLLSPEGQEELAEEAGRLALILPDLNADRDVILRPFGAEPEGERKESHGAEEG